MAFSRYHHSSGNPNTHCHRKLARYKVKHSLMLLCLLFNISDLLRELLQGVLEVGVLELKLYRNITGQHSSCGAISNISNRMDKGDGINLPCCFFKLACCWLAIVKSRCYLQRRGVMRGRSCCDIEVSFMNHAKIRDRLSALSIVASRPQRVRNGK